MTSRAIRIAHRFASVAESVKDHRGSPKRRASSAPTHSASAVGSIVVIPPRSRIRAVTASTVAPGLCPAIAPVSPIARSTYSWPSTSTTRLPRARSRYSGKPPLHMFIQVIGTRPNRWSARA